MVFRLCRVQFSGSLTVIMSTRVLLAYASRMVSTKEIAEKWARTQGAAAHVALFRAARAGAVG
jgi:hypothetical protein